jgi:hypothetical protein
MENGAEAAMFPVELIKDRHSAGFHRLRADERTMISAVLRDDPG